MNNKFKDAEIFRVYGEEEKPTDENTKWYYFDLRGMTYKTANPAIAARYEARDRLFKRDEKEKELLMDSKEYERYSELWSEASRDDKNEQKRIADELNKMFR